jgi:multicomponent Na+:H+ antiporter subunit E
MHCSGKHTEYTHFPMQSTTNIPLQFLNLWLTLMLIWLIANSTLALDTVIAGAVISTVIALIFAAFSQVYSVIRWSPKVIFYYLIYLCVFFIELVKANLNVLRLVFSPRIDIHPGIVEIKTGLKSPIGRLALANSITLTPGTLVVDIIDDSLFIHWINVSSTEPVAATEKISSRFEKYLKVIYG